MRIELIGGPACGAVRETALPPKDGKWEETYTVQGTGTWDVLYTRTGYFTRANAHRYDFAGQEMHPAVKF